MKILIASPEVVPFAKTGGLADVTGALPKALAKQRHDVRIVMPRYRMVDASRFGLTRLMPELDVVFSGTRYKGAVDTCTIPGTTIPVYFIVNDTFFNRDELYVVQGKDYPDNPLRFAFFSMAALWMLRGIGWQPDIIHCNDWQTALVPTYLKNHPELRSDSFYRSIKVLYSIHNLAYQGMCGRDTLPTIGLGWDLFNMEGLEFYGKVNLMKGGIVFADAISTVSRQYAQEIQTPEYGSGLDGILRTRADRLHGILNGIDYDVWNPEIDTLIPATYSAANLENKAVCKRELQRYCQLPEEPRTPLIGMVSRLADQKGFDILAKAIEPMMQIELQLVLLGTGDPKYHELFRTIAKKYPKKTGIHLKFDNRLAHWIEAGSDMFLMPSRYEPCGLNQLYSLRYGTIPVVRKTGGLADSITPVTPATLKSGKATGFFFTRYTAKDLLRAVQQAVSMYQKDPAGWQKLMLAAMQKDFSWNASARQYAKLYQSLIRQS
jgi:starch synthase